MVFSEIELDILLEEFDSCSGTTSLLCDKIPAETYGTVIRVISPLTWHFYIIAAVSPINKRNQRASSTSQPENHVQSVSSLNEIAIQVSVILQLLARPDQPLLIWRNSQCILNQAFYVVYSVLGVIVDFYHRTCQSFDA